MRARLAATEQRRAGLPDVADAKSAFDAARVALERARSTQMNASKAKAAVGEQAVRERLAVNEVRLADPDAVARRPQRQSDLVEKALLLKGYARELDEASRKIDAAQLQDPAAEARRFAKSADILRNEQTERQSKIAQLRARLEALGASGIGEKLAQADAAIEQLMHRHAELRLRADALYLLETVLVEERNTAIATLRVPLTQRLGHYLKL